MGKVQQHSLGFHTGVQVVSTHIYLFVYFLGGGGGQEQNSYKGGDEKQKKISRGGYRILKTRGPKSHSSL